MSHNHSHHHHDHSHSYKNIKTAFFLNLAFTLFELVGGFYVNSVAILSDALHDLGDSLSLGLAWYLTKKSQQEADEKFTFGYQRFSLLGALVNSLILIIGAVYVVREAIDRLLQPEETDAKGMLIFAIVGVLVNGYAAYKLSHGKTLNEKVVSWHLIEDVLGWMAVLVASVVMIFKDIPYLDPALSLGITLFILWNVVKSLKDTLRLFLQGNPAGYDVEVICGKISDIPHVDGLHHTRLWSLDGEHHVFSTHVVLTGVDTLPQVITIKKEISRVLKDYGLSYHTIEMEIGKGDCSSGQFCEEDLPH